MRLTITGIRAWIAFIIVMALAILFLVFLLNLIILVIPFLIVLAILIWFFSLLKKTTIKAKGFTKKKGKSVVDVEFEVK